MPNDETLSDGERGRGIKRAVADAPAPFRFAGWSLSTREPWQALFVHFVSVHWRSADYLWQETSFQICVIQR
jgi:hypothetical protein